MCLIIYFTLLKYLTNVLGPLLDHCFVLLLPILCEGGSDLTPCQITNFEPREVNFTFFPLKLQCPATFI